MRFLAAGATHMARLCCAGNRTGKSEMATWEVALHATGLYPHWWKGRRFNHAVDIWVAGETSETTRDILQAKLLGATEREAGSTTKVGLGTGMIPADLIVSHAPKAGVPNAIDTVWIKHTSGRNSSIGFKSYGKDQGTATSWMGTRKHVILLDEEPDFVTYGEAMMRLMSTVPTEPSGIMLITFTPLKGYTEVVKNFLESDDPGLYHQFISWDECPHLSPAAITEMSRKFLPSQLKARSQGIPVLGEGAIYPIDIDEVSVSPFPIPDYWPRCYGMDVGKTAVIWLAQNPDNGVVTAYDEYFSLEYNPVVHADAIKRRGPIPGVIDPSSLQSNQMDGQKLFEIYRSKGLDIAWEKTGVESGIQTVWEMLNSGTLKFFTTLDKFRQEFQRYHRIISETKTGQISKIVKKDDHLLDSCRYAVVSGLKRAKPMTWLNRDRNREAQKSVMQHGGQGSFFSGGNGAWMG